MSNFRSSVAYLLLVALSITAATPLKRHTARQRQSAALEATTAPKIGYPPAGFRPRIPFELPNERKPKVLPPDAATTTTPFGLATPPSSDVDVATAATPREFEPTQTEANPVFPPLDDDDVRVGVQVPGTVDVEVIIDQDGKVGANGGEEDKKEGDDEVEVEVKVEVEDIPDDVEKQERPDQPEVKKTETDENDRDSGDDEAKRKEGEGEEIETHTPADTYGAPDFSDSNNAIKGNRASSDDNEIDNSVDLIEKPAEQFIPPNKDFQEFSAAPTNDAAVRITNTQLVLDVPVGANPNANDNGEGSAFSDISIEIETNEAKLLPAPTYGPPTTADGRLPANTYGAPGGSAGTGSTNSDAESDFAGEANELESTAEEVELAAEQIELLSGLSDLKSGRLIFVPADGTNLRQIYFADVHGTTSQVRQGATNGRLQRV